MLWTHPELNRTPFAKPIEVRSERDKPTTPCALIDIIPSDTIWSSALRSCLSFRIHTAVGALVPLSRKCEDLLQWKVWSGAAVIQSMEMDLLSQKEPQYRRSLRKRFHPQFWVTIGGARSSKRCQRLRTEKLRCRQPKGCAISIIMRHSVPSRNFRLPMRSWRLGWRLEL